MCCKRALGIKQFKSSCYRRWDFCSISLLRLSFCRPVKLQPLARWSKYIGSGFCRKNPISWLSLRQQARRKMERKSTPSLRQTLYTCRYAHAQNAVDAEKLFPLTCSVSTCQVLETHGHKRSSSWGRTYSFSSAINRGCLTGEQHQDVKAGIQPTLQVLPHTHTHSRLTWDSNNITI